MNWESIDLEKQLHKFEINFVTGTLPTNVLDINLDQFPSSSNDKYSQDLDSIIKNIANHNYKEILSINFQWLQPFQNFLKECTPVFSIENGEIKSNYKNFFHSSDENCPYVKQLILLLVASAALQEFVRTNLCGPTEPDETVYPICYSLLPDTRFTNNQVLDALGKNGETILTKISHPKLLFLSLLLFFGSDFDKCLTHKWWLFRCLMIHQKILFERVPELHNSITSLMKTQGEFEFLSNEEELLAKIMFYTECAHVYLHYHEVNLAEKLISNAQSILSLNIELSGAMGKRTRFQSKSTAQLLVKTNKKYNQYNSNLIFKNISFPCDLVLQDDTVLNKIELTDGEKSENGEISPEEQIVILAYCSLIQKKMASTELKREEVMSFVDYLLSQPKIWSLQVKVLTMRCQVEKETTRKFERSLSQLEELINSIKKEEPPFSVRQIALYSVAFPFSYHLEELLAGLLMSMGSIKSALEIYERLQLWEDAVICYKQLNMTSKAVKVLEKLIAEKPSPLLWCYLGDVLDDPEKYVVAWELSMNRNARSQRSLGYYYFKRKDYKRSITHFTLSAEVNHLQPTLWFSLGYAATECEEYELAAQAYRQVVSLDHDNFEAWNNLSNAYIKMKQKARAWRSLQEALKCNYEEWRVWENFLLVSVDIGAFEDVIRSFHRLLDIKGKHVDSEVLKILVNAIERDLPDFHDSPSSRLKDKTLQLFGRLTSITTNNPTLWELYSILQCSGTNVKNDKEMLEKAVTFQHKAVRSYIQDPSWEQKIETYRLALQAALRFAELSISYTQLLEDPLQQQQQKSRAKYSLQNIVTRAEKAQEHFTEEECPQDKIIALKSSLNSLCDL